MTMIIPRPQKETYHDGNLMLSGNIKVDLPEEFSEKILNVLNIFIPDVNFEACSGGEIVFLHEEDIKTECYNLDVNDRVTVKFGDFIGARNAASTIAQLMSEEADGYSIQKCSIEDYPLCEVRSFMMDLARGIGRKKEIEETIVRMALMKYNRLHLHLIDGEGVAWQSKAYPKLTGPQGDQYSMQYFKKINDLCEGLGLEILPEIEVPGHNTSILKAYPEYACEVDEEKYPAKWVMCAGNDGIFEFYTGIIKEVIEMFPSCKSIHIGGDEIHFYNMESQQCHWEVCPKCQALGYENMQEIFYYVIKRVYDIVRSFGKGVAMWNDWIDISKEEPLPKDIEIEFWRVSQDGPQEGCSMAKFMEQGYKVVNAYYKYTYFCYPHLGRPEMICDWLPNLIPESDPQYHHLIIGGDACAWEYGNEERYRFYRFTLPSQLGLFADRLWNGSYHPYDKEYEIALTRSILGLKCKKGFNIFELLGTIMLKAKTEELGFLENITATDDELREAMLDMIPVTVSGKYGCFAALYYTECLHWIISNR